MTSSILANLKERKLVQWALAYLAGAWLLLQLVDVLDGLYAVPQALVQILPVLLAVGFLITLVLAWYHGVRGRQRPGMVEIALLVTLVVVGGGFATSRVRSAAPRAERPAAAVARTAIAVLPLENLGGEDAHSYFAAGLHDELLTQLSRISALKVISRTSVMGYAKRTASVEQIGRELGVGSVLEGSVQVVGNRLRVNVQLIDAATDAHIWAESYDRTLDDAFAIQSDIARNVVGAVGAALSGVDQLALSKAPTPNAEAYRLYLQGRQHHVRPGFTRSNYETAELFYERAIAQDPNFALARVALADVNSILFGLRLDPTPERFDRMVRETNLALKLDPELPQAHYAMAYVHGMRGERELALKEMDVALKRLPNSAELWQARAEMEMTLGNWDAAIDATQRSLQLNPRDATVSYQLGTLRTWTRNYRAAHEAYEYALEVAPDFHIAAVVRGWSYLHWQGQLDTIQAVLARVPDSEHLEAYGSRTVHQLDLLHWKRQPDAMLRLIEAGPNSPLVGQPFFWPRQLYRAWAHRMRGDEGAARAAFDSARVVSASSMKTLPADDWRVHVAHGLALAGLGRRAEARAEARWIEQLPRYRENVFWGPMLGEGRARILAQAGYADEAAAEIQKLLARPAFFSVHSLRFDPLYDPIREHEGIRAISRQK